MKFDVKLEKAAIEKGDFYQSYQLIFSFWILTKKCNNHLGTKVT